MTHCNCKPCGAVTVQWLCQIVPSWGKSCCRKHQKCDHKATPSGSTYMPSVHLSTPEKLQKFALDCREGYHQTNYSTFSLLINASKQLLGSIHLHRAGFPFSRNIINLKVTLPTMYRMVLSSSLHKSALNWLPEGTTGRCPVTFSMLTRAVCWQSAPILSPAEEAGEQHGTQHLQSASHRIVCRTCPMSAETTGSAMQLYSIEMVCANCWRGSRWLLCKLPAWNNEPLLFVAFPFWKRYYVTLSVRNIQTATNLKGFKLLPSCY